MRGVYRENPVELDDKATAMPSLDAGGNLVVSVGGGSDVAWDGVSDDASVVGVLKAIHAVLVQIETNTSA